MPLTINLTIEVRYLNSYNYSHKISTIHVSQFKNYNVYVYIGMDGFRFPTPTIGCLVKIHPHQYTVHSSYINLTTLFMVCSVTYSLDSHKAITPRYKSRLLPTKIT